MHTNEYFRMEHSWHKNCNTSRPAINFAAQRNLLQVKLLHYCTYRYDVAMKCAGVPLRCTETSEFAVAI